MAVSLDSPLGSTSRPFVRSAGVTWDPRLTVPNNVPNTGPLILGNLTMIAEGGGAGQGTCVPVRYSKAAGTFYFEVTWSGLIGTLSGCGVGIISTEALAGVRDLADVAAVYVAFAADGSNGCLFRPNGTVYETVPNGNGVTEASQSWPLLWHTSDGEEPIPCIEGDTLGIMVNFDAYAPNWVAVSIYGVGGSVRGVSAGNFFPPAGTYVPCAVFGSASAFDILAVTANFGADPGSLRGPKISSLVENGTFDGVTLGWPATL